MQALRYLLFPFAFLYAALTGLRNWLFDAGILPSYRSGTKVIIIGNLNVGGTGKTPFTEYLLKNLTRFNGGVVSRGYGRKTKGLRMVNVDDDPRDVGDEALQIKSKFKNVPFVVSEKRKKGIQLLENDLPHPGLILLDDAFQHRHVTGTCTILLSTFSKPFFRDLILPVGNLREMKRGKNRADFIVITKCPEDLSDEQKQHYLKRIKPESGQQVFFAGLKYGQWFELMNQKSVQTNAVKNGLLISGIAGTQELESYLKQHVQKLKNVPFKDHMDYRAADVEKLLILGKSFFPEEAFSIFTTEKDATKLRRYADILEGMQVVVVPVEVVMEDEQHFLTAIRSKINDEAVV